MSRKLIHKLFNTKASSVDEEAKSVTFVISTNDEDRYGEVVDQKSWDFKSYLKNPLVLWGHDPSEPENVLGTASSLQVANDGSETTAVLTFNTDINPKADLVFNQIRKGTLRTVSVGFINHTFNVEKDVPVLSDNELLEISVVPIPANSGAVALGLKAGEINRKDAKWLMDSMRKEADLMEEQYNATKPVTKEKTMTDEQAQAVIDGMAKLTEQVATLTTENQALRDEVAALKPAEETEQEKAAREAQEAKDAEEAAAKAEADKKAADEEAARKAEEDAKDPAKGGEDDQPGAGETDAIDDDAELTPELQEKIDAELEAANA
jgi:HK97 family phage prohead protease